MWVGLTQSEVETLATQAPPAFMAAPRVLRKNSGKTLGLRNPVLAQALLLTCCAILSKA